MLTKFDWVLQDGEIYVMGVTFDRSLSFNGHIDQVVKDCLQLFALDDPHAILSIYIGLVRSKLDFASVVWRPLYVTQINRLEQIQKKFVRFALRHLGWKNDELPPYQQLCGLVDLDTVHSRHTIADVTFFSNVLAGRTKSQRLRDNLTFNDSPTVLRRRRIFEPPNRSRNYTQHEPCTRFMTEFNLWQM
ncbi:uncharacterized protein LOC131687065 [Topomyia yanbarensis]|uniref:uncharacterized protein LOC131687065 n=1 Tax=Topomyia yanbarensis TaxID=2498891 RepID=UPI00273C76F1|nr:uncharacterized protein LOC131687065 [Topomyia yanbarensis]